MLRREALRSGDFRNGSDSEVVASASPVRSTPDSRHLGERWFSSLRATTGLARAPGRGGAGRRLAFDPRRTRCARFRFGERIIHWREEETLPGVG